MGKCTGIMAYNPETMSFELGDNDCDMVYVSGLPPDATEADIAEHFGSIGVVKFDKKQNKHKIWMYRDKMTGAPKGDCTVTYEGAGLPTPRAQRGCCADRKHIYIYIKRPAATITSKCL